VPQRIRFCETPAGLVAYSVIGRGPALIIDTGWVTHLEKMLEIPSIRACIDRLSQEYSVIRYDKLGSGLSDRAPKDISFDAQVAQVLAVADQLKLLRFNLFGASQGGQVMAAVAARHPGRVEKLILYGACARGADLAPADVQASLLSLVRSHWGLFSKTLSAVFIPEPNGDEAQLFAGSQRAVASPEMAANLLAEYYRTDVSAELSNIHAPTLVMHRDADATTRFELGRELAARIPGATFIPLRGSTHLFYFGDWEAVLDSILAFLAKPADDAAALSPREIEVATLVAEGMTNQEIAMRLRVAPRTADAHLEHIRIKLGVRSRAQVAAWASTRSGR
jgi:pimeloyl-ACP methyl ester carboxylesterase/DNA-binding CsgD family transcriptional regulator